MRLPGGGNRLIGQTDLLVLALHFHQQRARPAQQRYADRLIVDERTGPPVLRQYTAQHHIVVRVQSLLGQ